MITIATVLGRNAIFEEHVRVDCFQVPDFEEELKQGIRISGLIKDHSNSFLDEKKRYLLLITGPDSKATGQSKSEVKINSINLTDRKIISLSCLVDSAPRSSIPMAMPPKSSMASVNTEEGLAKRFWNKFMKESKFAMYTPFAVCLASGNLKIESFRHYIAQDGHFLRAFAQAYELAGECADDDDAKLGISELRKAVLEELKMHDSLLKEWGLDLAKEYSINSATVKYTDFLLATASGKVDAVKGPGKLATPFEKTKIAAYTLGATTPCMRLYAFLGKQFQLLNSNKGSHPFQKWIDNYSSEGFQASALKTEDLLDKLSAPLTGEELDVIEKLYYQAMNLEIDFFSAQPLFQPTVLPLTEEHNPEKDRLMIFSDFDMTCTVVDSSAILAEIAIVTAPKVDQPDDQIVRMPSAELRNTWVLLSQEYTEEYEQCIESIMSAERLANFDFEKLSAALEQLSKFEKKANDRVIESGVLKGLNLEEIKRAGEHLILQDGCANFFQKAVKNEKLNSNVHILSYCWCDELIRSTFASAGLTELNVHANEFVFEESVSTGEIVKKVETPIEKLQAFRDILKNCNDDKKNVTVYIGDSVGDLLCLLEADVGIVIDSSSSLRRVARQYGVSFVPLYSGLIAKQKEYIDESSSIWKGLSGVLYTIRINKIVLSVPPPAGKTTYGKVGKGKEKCENDSCNIFSFGLAKPAETLKDDEVEALEDKNKVQVHVFGGVGTMANNTTRMK
ncbi:bifunctional TH2 protein, mitochondrial [Senna tora]|uniref:Bifunctional TH2 protein, mitochondrial n=1 Tax=Senna tora TaxID=362788 RepID=A0A834T8T5_9FABA|nr:bifunctional TH2 protein, mitochondrial [Senna tora]